MTCGILFFECKGCFFNSYVYYLTCGFIASTRTFNLPARVVNLLNRGFNLPTCAFNLVTRAFSPLTLGFN